MIDDDYDAPRKILKIFVFGERANGVSQKKKTFLNQNHPVFFYQSENSELQTFFKNSPAQNQGKIIMRAQKAQFWSPFDTKLNFVVVCSENKIWL